MSKEKYSFELRRGNFSNEGAARSGAIEFIINIAEEIIEKLKDYDQKE